jgi:hypothetical protein
MNAYRRRKMAQILMNSIIGLFLMSAFSALFLFVGTR